MRLVGRRWVSQRGMSRQRPQKKGRARIVQVTCRVAESALHAEAGGKGLRGFVSYGGPAMLCVGGANKKL